MKFKSFSIDCYLCLFLFGGLALTFAGHGTFVDENLIIQTVESFVEHGNLTVSPMFQALPSPDGHSYYSRYGFGFPLLMVPFYYAGSLLGIWFPGTHAFYGNPHFFAMLWANLLIHVLEGWLFYRLCRLAGGQVNLSVTLTLALIFATPFWPYSKTLFRLTASGATFVGVLCFVINYLRENSLLPDEAKVKKGTYSAHIIPVVAIVLLTALGLNIREDLVIGFMLIGLFVLWRGRGKKRWFAAAALIFGALSGFLLWGLHNWIRFGHFFIENYEDLNFNYPLVLSLPQLLFGLRRGILFYAPLALLLPLSWKASQEKHQFDLWLLCTAVFASYLFLYAKSDMWHGGRCWGPRHLYFLLPFALLPGIWWLDVPTRGKKWFFAIACAFGVIINLPGVYSHPGKYQDFFSCPSFLSLLTKPVVHPEYITFDELDWWWVRMIKMNPGPLWPMIFAILVAFTIWSGYRLWKSIHTSPSSTGKC